MDDVIKVQDRWYILATSSRADDRTLVLKQGDTFAVFDRHGDIHALGLARQGLFHDGTRYLSRFETRLGGARPLLLSATTTQDDTLLVANCTNPDVRDGERVVVPRDTIHLLRTSFLWDGVLHSRLRVRSYERAPRAVDLTLLFESDFADIFEVRGAGRPRRGTLVGPAVEPDVVRLAYDGLDGVRRTTTLRLDPPPVEIEAGRARWRLDLPAGGQATIVVTASCDTASGERPPDWDRALADVRRARARSESGVCRVLTSNEQFDEWLARSSADLAMMTTELPTGPYPYAGVPWFSTPFGRDGIITAFETLWTDPRLAGGVLRYLAHTQATVRRPDADAEPGKILHEARGGEMAALGEVPFGRYYGSIDATPLFVMLAAAHWRRTADRATAELLWPHVVRALHWIDRHGDVDGDGFVEYARQTERGLQQQGWKDSEDSVFHSDGSLAAPPIALCEVQGYVYAAKLGASTLAMALGHTADAQRLAAEAETLRRRFEVAFWDEELSTYVLALDGAKRPCRVRTSNAGHCLFAGIAGVERARRVADALMAPDSFCGWGVRTAAASAARYNPMSYHNGSVWPHDNALVAAGLASYGLQEPVMAIVDGLFAACLGVELRRLPELFCGFSRRPGEGPTSYPVACAPQAWAAGAVFLLLQSCIGLRIDAPARSVRFAHPCLPPFLDRVALRDLRVGDASVDVDLVRHADDVGVTVVRREGVVEVVVVK